MWNSEYWRAACNIVDVSDWYWRVHNNFPLVIMCFAYSWRRIGWWAAESENYNSLGYCCAGRSCNSVWYRELWFSSETFMEGHQNTQRKGRGRIEVVMLATVFCFITVLNTAAVLRCPGRYRLSVQYSYSYSYSYSCCVCCTDNMKSLCLYQVHSQNCQKQILAPSVRLHVVTGQIFIEFDIWVFFFFVISCFSFRAHKLIYIKNQRDATWQYVC